MNDSSNSIVLTCETEAKNKLQAVFLPDKGMNLASYKKDGLEIIDQSTIVEFKERFAGLGALIGPHFHRRKEEILPKVANEALFPHIARVKSRGIIDPFSHGISRYAPWKATSTLQSFKATLSGKDEWNGVPLSVLEGQNFTMNFEGELTSKGLVLKLDVVSDTDSVVGIHYYYHLPEGKGSVISSVQKEFIEEKQRKSIPKEWLIDQQQTLSFDLSHGADYTFFPYPNPCEGKILLDAKMYQLMTIYKCRSQENSWQLYHPQGASFVCIEPLSSQDPRHPNLSVSRLEIVLEIL